MTRSRREGARDTSETGESSQAHADPTAEGVDPWDGAPHRADTFSPLLWVPHRLHRVSLASIEDETMLTVRHRSPEVAYVANPLMDRYLINLGLYQLATMKQPRRIDQALMCGLVERWRSETHSFHLPVGEMTVTLQDVSALWGLRIDGDPVGGVSDHQTLPTLIPELLGVHVEGVAKKLKRKNENDDEKFSQYCISLKALRQYAAEIAITPLTSDVEHVKRYVRAFVLDLCGTTMFVDSSGDSVPIMFLQQLELLDKPSRWNWGGAVLACLYRGLCHACLRGSQQFNGPLLLLQQWSWSHLPVCRPEIQSNVKWQRGSDIDKSPPYGSIWGSRLRYFNTPRGGTAGISYVRNQLQLLHQANIEWFPYRPWYQARIFCRLTMEQRDLGLYRGPVVCYWIVEYHYPDRVPRQFGFDAFIPDDPILGEDETEKLHNTFHKKTEVDWSGRHLGHYRIARTPENHLWVPPNPADVSLGAGPWALRYMVWYQRWCMNSVYLQGDYGDSLRRRMMGDESKTHLPSGPTSTRAVLTGIRGVAHSLVCMAKKSFRAFGCTMLHHTAPIVEDSQFDGRLIGMLHDAGENINWREIKKDSPAPNEPNQERELVYADDLPPPPEEDNPDWAFHDWVLDNKKWHAYYNKFNVPVQLGEDGHPIWCAEPTFTPADFGLTATGVEDLTGATPSMPPPRQHDHEASGSGAQQPTDAWETAAFGTQPPSTYTGDWEFDPWETDPSQATQYDPWPDSYRRSTGTMQEDRHMDHSDDEEDMHVDLTHNEDPPQPRRRRVQRQKTRVQPPRACGAAPRLSLSGRRRR